MKNRILFLSNAYPDFDSSYRGIFIKKMATLLQNEGYEISVVTPKIYRGSHYFENQSGIRIYRFPFLAGNRRLIEYKTIPYFRMVLYYISGFLFTVCVLLKNKCNLIHVHWAIPTGLVGVLAGDLLKKPLVVTIHGSDFRIAMGKSSLLQRAFLFVCKKAMHVNCVSEVMKKEIVQLGIRKEKIMTIPMGVEKVFLGIGENREKNSNSKPFTILSNRNLQPLYNVSQLIASIPYVLKEEPNVQFLIAGDGPEREVLEKKVKHLNLDSSVQFLGRIPHEKMPALLGKATIYISTSPYDGTSVSLLEAMASGAFPIVTDIPANREWVKDGENGFLTQTSEESFLANKIIEAIRNEKLMMESRARNLSIVGEKALWSTNIRRMIEVYTRC